MAPRTEQCSKDGAKEKKFKLFKKHRIFAVHKGTIRKSVSNKKLRAKVIQLSKDLKEHKNETERVTRVLKEYSECVHQFADKLNEHVEQQNTQSGMLVTAAGLTRRRVGVLEERMGWASRMLEKMVLYMAREDTVTMEAMRVRDDADATRDEERWKTSVRSAAWTSLCVGLSFGVWNA
jgi:predicted transcriptional regulator